MKILKQDLKQDIKYNIKQETKQDIQQELFEIYKRNFPFVVREDKIVMHIFDNQDNVVIEKRDEQQKLIGVSVLNQNTILLLCVNQEHRNQGIGTWLLENSEMVVASHGYEEIIVGAGFDYIMPGVPTAKPYVKAENEKLYQHIDETARDFFTKRGYEHSWNCNCFDMRLSLSEFDKDEFDIGDTIEGITYNLATIKDLDEICVCIDDAYQDFTVYYQDESLYQNNQERKVLIASSHGEVAGALIMGMDNSHFGNMGCVAVKHAYQGKHIAVNLVTIGTKYLKDMGVKEVYLGYTYTGLDHLYGYAGYKICIYYMMAVKKL